MNDLISRQVVIDIAMQYCPDDDGTCSKGDRDIRELLDDLENLPSAQPETSLMTVTVAPDSEEIERVFRRIKDAPVMVLPSAQPERKTGKWIRKPNIYGVAYCSECDYELHTNNTNFCPNCGAKMEVNGNE